MKLEQQVLEAEKFIASIPCSKIRTLFSLRFLEGEEWGQAAKRFYKKMTEDSARKTVTRYFEAL